MGEMIYKELVMVKFGEYWQHVFNKSLTNEKNIITFNQCKEILEVEFQTLINKEILQINNEIYLLSDVEISCINCG